MWLRGKAGALGAGGSSDYACEDMRWRATTSVGLGAVALALLGGCGGAQYQWSQSVPANAESAGKQRTPRIISPARLLALPEPEQADFTIVDADGSRRLVAYGIRILDKGDGSIEQAVELLPATGKVQPIELPPRLGGGYLFHAVSGGTTRVWRSATWTGPLEPFASTSSRTSAIVPGFDRVYLLGQTGSVLALDAATGNTVDTGPLPASPGYGSMAFADGWLGAVDTAVRGVLVTFDAGASWRPLGMQTSSPGVRLHEGQLLVQTSTGTRVIDAEGVVRSYSSSAAKSAEDGPSTAVPKPLGERPLSVAALHGWPETKKTAVVATGGALGRVRVSDGKVLKVVTDAYPGGGSCHGIALGRRSTKPGTTGAGFVCGREDGRTTVYELKLGLKLEPVLSFDEPRYISASGNGALVIRGGCDSSGGTVDDDGAHSYCIRSSGGNVREIRVRGDAGVERVVALRDGRAAVIVPPRLGARGLLTLVSEDGSAKTMRMKLPKTSGSMKALLRKGLWLDGWVQRGSKKGELSGWVAAGGPFVGVRIGLDGKVRIGELEDDIDRSLISGELAFVLGRGGRAAQSVDGGFTWTEVVMPDRLNASGSLLPKRGSKDARRERGCSPVGCGFGPLVRVGWDSKQTESQLKVAEMPPPTTMPRRGGGRWLYQCAPTGKSVAPPPKPAPTARTAQPRRPHSPHGVVGILGRSRWRPHGGSVNVKPEASPWTPFRSVAAPRKAADATGFTMNISSSGSAKTYVWGPEGADWDRVGNWLLRAADDYALTDSVWSTATSRSPWADMHIAAQTFGREYSGHGGVNWSLEPDPEGRAAAVLVRARGIVELHLAEEGRSIVSVNDVSRWSLSSLSGAVKVNDVWHIGAQLGSRTFRVFRVVAGELELVGEYPGFGGSGSLHMQVVRNTAGNSLGIWARDTAFRGSRSTWYVYPIDPATGEAGAPLVLDPEALGNTPISCSADDDGWLLEGQAPVTPYLDFDGPSAGSSATSVQLRVVAASRRMCVHSLRGYLSGAPPKTAIAGGVAAWAGDAPTAPLVLRQGGGRYEFRCKR